MSRATLLAAVMVAGCDSGSAPTPPTPRPPTTRAIAETLDAGEILFRSERLEDAEDLARTLTTRAPQRWEGHELLGRVLAAQALQALNEEAATSLRRAAVESYDAAIARHPDDAALHHARGLVLLAAGRADDAGRAFAEAARLDPESAQYPLFEAQVHLAAGRVEEARACLERVMDLRPDEPFALASLAECARQAGDLRAALDAIRSARTLDPGALAFRVAEARILRLSGRPRDGLELLLAAGEAQWSDPSAIEEVALGWTSLGDHGRAAQAWEASHLRHPENVDALHRAADAWREAGDPVRARLLEEEAELRVQTPRR